MVSWRKVVGLIIVFLLLVVLTVVTLQYRTDIAAARQRVREGSIIAATDIGQIEYSVVEEGVPALLIHGAGGGYDQGLLLGKTALGGGFKCIAVSRFGYLRSPFVGESTVELQAALYAALLDHLEIDRVIVVGGSAGGPSALQFAHDYPERCLALILVSAVSMYMGDEIPLSTKIINTIQRSDFAYWLVIRLFQSQFLNMIGISPEVYSSLSPEGKYLVDEMLAVMHPMSPRRPGNIHEARIRPLAAEGMSRITVPTMILHARDDGLVTFDHAEFVHNNIPHSLLVPFEQGGHGLVAESRVIRKHIGDFLDQITAPTP